MPDSPRPLDPLVPEVRRSRRWWVWTLLLTSIAVCGSGPAVGESQIFDDGIGDRQEKLLAELTGHRPADGWPGGPRSTPDERAQAADYLAGALEGLGLMPRRHEYRFPNVNPLVDLLLAPYRGTNVWAVVEANRPDAPYVVLGAHYDTVPDCPGAVDNASGVALVYSVADRISRRQDRRFNYLFVFFDQEEDDEVGSRAFARHLIAEELDVHSVHVTDLVGWDEDGDRAVEVQSPGPELEREYRAAAGRLGLTLYVTEGASSDNKSFLATGFRTAGVWEEWDHGDSTPHLHRETDTYETVDLGFLVSTTELVHDVLIHLGEPPGSEPAGGGS